MDRKNDPKCENRVPEDPDVDKCVVFLGYFVSLGLNESSDGGKVGEQRQVQLLAGVDCDEVPQGGGGVYT